MSVQCVHVPMLEAKIYSPTDIFSDLRLQRSKHSRNCARSSEQRDMLGLGQFSIPETIVVCGDRKSRPKIHCKTTRNFFAASSEKERLKYLPSIGLAYEPIPFCSSCQIGDMMIIQTFPLVESFF